MTYTCPKCGMPMICVQTASIPPYTRYQCSCGYSSKVIRGAAWKNMLHDLNGYLDMDKKEYMIDGILEMVKGSLMEVDSGT